MKGTFSLVAAAIIAFCGRTSFAQGETAVPFLMIPTSVEGNGMGGIGSSLITDDAIAAISNPAQLGIFSLNNQLSLGTYAPKTGWLRKFTGDVNLDATAISAGMRLNRYFDLPAPIGIGIGYSQVYLDLGMFDMTGAGGSTVLARYHAFEKAENLSLGLGIDYVVRLAVGYSFKWIYSELAPFGTEQEPGKGKADATAHDVGVLLQVPVVEIMDEVRKSPVRIDDQLSPIFNVTFGLAERNVGGGVNYGFSSQADLLPRQLDIGWNFQVGVTTTLDNEPWKLFSVTWAREAEEVMVSVRRLQAISPPGDTTYHNVYSYKSGLGDLRPVDNLLLGKTYGNIDLQKGLEFQLAECLYVRSGSYTGTGSLIYSTRGGSFKLNGFIRLLTTFYGLERPDWLNYMLHHVDLQYHVSSYSSRVSPIDGTEFHAITIVLR